MSAQITPPARRDADTDAMRVIAAFFVVMIHCAGLASPAGVFYNALSRFSVPVFVLLSGYYLLPRDFSPAQALRRAGLLVLSALGWSAFYLVTTFLRGAPFPGGLGCLQWLLTQPVHLWYLQALAGLTLFLPLLQLFHRSAGRQQYHYALALTFFLGSLLFTLLRLVPIPTLHQAVDRTKVPTMLGFPFLALAGGYFHRFPLSAKGRRWAVLAAAFGTAATIALALAGLGEGILSFFSPFVLLAAIGFFVLLQGRAFSPRLAQLFSQLAKAMGGVYLLHPLVLELLPWPIFAPVLSVPLRTATVYGLTLAIVLLLRFIRPFRTFL